MTSTWWDQTSLLNPEDIGVVLLTITHPDMAETLRFAALDVDITSRGETFIGYPMGLRIPSQGHGPKAGSITIAAVDPRIKQVVEGLKEPPQLLIELVSRDDFDDLFYDHGGLVFRAVRGDDTSLSGEIGGLGSLNDQWPRTRAIPEITPGVFVS